jgi:predicted alpha/beta-hydrolase family hydrolase
MPDDVKEVTIAIADGNSVSGLLQAPARATACYVFAHGAGAGMTHRAMTSVADGLGERGVATLRYQFPYMERGSKRPDRPETAHAAVRAAVREARRVVPDLPLIAGGRSFGGRMTSQAQAKTPLDGVRGLAFLAFPLHASGKPSQERAEHLFGIEVPMLFLQGTRDTLAELDQLNPVIETLGQRATLKLLAEADHSFHVPAKTGRRDADVLAELLDVFAAWTARIIAAP